MDTILESVENTGRLVVVDEADPRCGIAADIVARVAQDAFGDLKAPPRMVTPPHTPVPFSPVLEDAYVPSARRSSPRSHPRDDREPRTRMINKLGMPKWGLSMTEGRLLGWLVDEGAEVAVGQELAEVETEKITGAVEATAEACCAARSAASGRSSRSAACWR